MLTDKKKPSAILFFARDFLAVEFPHLAAYASELTPIYLVTTMAEKEIVQSTDASAPVFVLQNYIEAASKEAADADVAVDFERIGRDRFIPRLPRSDQESVVTGLERLLADVAEKFDVRLYLDEPVSGYLNDRLTQWVRDRGGLPCHFHTAWLPGHIFFTSDEAQDEPIPLGLVTDGESRVERHIEQRKAGAGRPLYVLDYSSFSKRWGDAGRLFLKGFYRTIRRDKFYMNRDPWPHFFHAQCLLKATQSEYAELDALLDDAANLVVVPLHYEPEAVLGYLWDGGDQVNLARDLRNALPRGAKLVLKEHPSQPGALAQEKWSDLIGDPQVLAMRGGESLEAVLAKGAKLVSIGSTAVLEAARLQAPVFVVGRPHFADAPGVTALESASEFATTPPKPAASERDLLAWYANFVNSFCVEGRFLKGNTELTNPSGVISALIEEAEHG